MEDDDDSAVAVSSMGVGPSLNDLLNANDDLLEYSHHHSINDMNSGSSGYLYRSQRDGSQIAGGAVDHDDEELPPPPYARYYASDLLSRTGHDLADYPGASLRWQGPPRYDICYRCTHTQGHIKEQLNF